MHSQQEEAEPKLDDMMAEPIVRLLMQKDNVATNDLTRLMRMGREIRENKLSYGS